MELFIKIPNSILHFIAARLAKPAPSAAHAPLCLSASPPQGGRSLTAAFPLFCNGASKRESGDTSIAPLTGETPPFDRPRRQRGGVSCGRFKHGKVRSGGVGATGMGHTKFDQCLKCPGKLFLAAHEFREERNGKVQITVIRAVDHSLANDAGPRRPER